MSIMSDYGAFWGSPGNDRLDWGAVGYLESARLSRERSIEAKKGGVRNAI